MEGNLLRPGSCHRFFQQAEIRRGGKGPRQAELGPIIGVRAGAHGNHHVPQGHAVGNPAGGTNAENLFHAVKVVQLIAVDAHGGHPHAAAHDGNPLAPVGTGISQHIPHGVEADRVFQIGFRDIFCPKRVSGHQNGLGDVAGHCAVVRGAQGNSLLLFMNGRRRLFPK